MEDIASDMLPELPNIDPDPEIAHCVHEYFDSLSPEIFECVESQN